MKLALAGPPAVWRMWVAYAAAGAAWELLAQAMGVSLTTPPVAPMQWLFVAGPTLLGGLILGAAMHVMVTGEPPRLDRRYLVFILLSAAMEAYWTGVVLLAPQESAGAVERLARFALLIVGMAGGVFVLSRLVLWPIGLLVGAGLTVRDSWVRMRGQVIPYLIAALLLSLPPSLVLVMAGAARAEGAGEVPPILAIAVAHLAATALVALTASLDVVMYRRRAGKALERLGEVFD